MDGRSFITNYLRFALLSLYYKQYSGPYNIMNRWSILNFVEFL
uniref:Uncharacterized protein n=1 Tax=Arundo donax TaxID=35708 RepID=A0A0A9F2P6_ARUDO